MKTQVFYPLKGYEGFYEINKEGIVRGVDRTVVVRSVNRKISPKILSTRINNYGYVEMRLSKDGKTKTFFLHVLLARTFIPNPENKPEVNHQDGNKQNNSLENLEWVTHSENLLHAYRTGLRKKLSKIVVDTCTGQQFENSKIAAIYSGINYNTLRGYLNGQLNNPTCLHYLRAA